MSNIIDRGADGVDAQRVTLREPITAEISGITSGTATPTIADVTASGTVAAGAKALWFELSSDFVGSILGKAYSGATTSVVSIPVPAFHSLSAVAYTRSAGTLTIFKAI